MLGPIDQCVGYFYRNGFALLSLQEKKKRKKKARIKDLVLAYPT